MSEKEYKFMFRSDLILEIKRLRKEYGQLRDRSYEKVEELEQQFKEANSKLVDAEFVLRTIFDTNKTIDSYFLKYYS